MHRDPNDHNSRDLFLELTEALAQGKVAAVKRLLAMGAPVNPKVVPGDLYRHSPPLTHAASEGDEEMCQILIDAGAKVDMPNGSGLTALHVAASSDHADACRTLIAAGAQVDARDEIGETPLFYAVRAGGGDAFRLLIEMGADVGARSRVDVTPLHFAALDRNLKSATTLLELGASPNVAARVDGPSAAGLGRKSAIAAVTPLHAAIWGPDNSYGVDFCRLLVSHGADPSFEPAGKISKDYYSPVQQTIRGRMHKVARYFLRECRIDFGQLTHDGRSASLRDLADNDRDLLEMVRASEIEQGVSEAIDVRNAGATGASQRSSILGPL